MHPEEEGIFAEELIGRGWGRGDVRGEEGIRDQLIANS
jgi:hypothetical protein